MKNLIIALLALASLTLVSCKKEDSVSPKQKECTSTCGKITSIVKRTITEPGRIVIDSKGKKVYYPGPTYTVVDGIYVKNDCSGNTMRIAGSFTSSSIFEGATYCYTYSW